MYLSVFTLLELVSIIEATIVLFFTFGRCFLNIWVSGRAIAFELVGFSFVELISFSSLFTIGLIVHRAVV